jgi:nucleotide-binding universal stress UspA family protein
MQSAKTDVAVYVGRQHSSFQKIFIPFIGGVHDLAAIRLAKRVIDGKNIEITILQVVDLESNADKYTKELSKLKQSFRSALINLQTVHTKDTQEVMLKEAKLGYDLIIIGVSEAWGLEPTLFGRKHERLSSECNASLLIVRKYTTTKNTHENWTTEDITIS